MTLLITKSFTAPESSEDVQKMLAQFRKYEYSSIPVQVIPVFNDWLKSENGWLYRLRLIIILFPIVF